MLRKQEILRGIMFEEFLAFYICSNFHYAENYGVFWCNIDYLFFYLSFNNGNCFKIIEINVPSGKICKYLFDRKSVFGSNRSKIPKIYTLG